MFNLETLAAWANIMAVPLALLSILVSVFISIAIYRRGKSKTSLSCILDPIAFPIEIKAGEALKGDIEIRYKGQPVKNLSVVRANLKNTGNIAIRASNIIENVTFTFPNAVELLRMPEIISKKPNNLKINWKIENSPSKAEMILELLNPGDEAVIEFLCAGIDTVPLVTARIEGLDQIQLTTAKEFSLQNNLGNQILTLIVVIASVTGFSIYAYLTDVASGGPSETYHSPIAIMFGFFATLCISGLFLGPYYLWKEVVKPFFDRIQSRHKS